MTKSAPPSPTPSSENLLPKNGSSATEVFDSLEAMRTRDVRWREGRAFSLAYNAGPDALAVAEEAYRRFSGENALNTEAFPSLKRIQAEVVAMAGVWLGATTLSAGFMTSGGTESILMAVKAARDRLLALRGVCNPNMVLPTSAHAAFAKAGAYFGVEVRRVAVQPDWRADVAAMREVTDENTVLIVGSAPQYPQGVVDDIVGIAKIAIDFDINCHVDACMGGVTLAYLARLGESNAPWNLQVPGVSSISVDLHKFGYTSKGASVIMYATKHLRSFQGFITDDWLGGVYGSSGVLGTKSGGSMASAWAVMHFLGDDGYLRLTREAREATLQLAESVRNSRDLVLRAEPESTLLCFGARDPSALNVFAVADELSKRGWYVDRQTPPDSLHCTVNAIHHDKIDWFARDLHESVAIALGQQSSGSVGTYGTVE
ncbi:MAG: aminotransferase class V-fold PLP-dependent enzyme [Actinomycetota bacterium]|nr:aminotransferase class V-fold PLP-dependent enzyme [Actinomycetota bacterium]